MDKANIDFESRSACDLLKRGAHIYAKHPSTQILMMGWAVGDMEPELWWAGQPFPELLRQHIESGGRVEAWNAQFERVMWPIMVRDHDAPPMPLEQWSCTMVRAFLMGFPGKLENAGPSMGLGVVKDAAGHRVMLQVSKPRRTAEPYENLPGITSWFDEEEGRELAALWWVDEERMSRVGEYCRDDVKVERAASRFLDEIPAKEHGYWVMDQRINDRGFHIDMELAAKARSLVKPALARANAELKQVTGGELTHATKPVEIKGWLENRLGASLPGVDKETLQDILHQEGDDIDPTVKEVIHLRLAAAKTSTAKLNALANTTGPENRVRGGLQFAGAGRTNRYAGRLFQPHNIPRPPKWAEQAIPYILNYDVDALDMLFDTPLEAVSAILRSCITTAKGKKLTVADYNAIEARVTAWLAGAEKMLDAYRTGKDPYRIMAASVFGVEDWRAIPKDSDQRFLGKSIILGAGFGMGHKKFHATCHKQGLRIDMELAERSIKTYREVNFEVPRMWYALEDAARRAVEGEAVSCLQGKVWFYRDSNFLRMRLPSGRVLSYLNPWLEDTETPWGSPTKKIWFWGWNGMANRMEWQNLYGGRLAENLAQAVARDILQEAIARLTNRGWSIILSVHDEILSEDDDGLHTVEDMEQIMTEPPEWAVDLPLAAEGWAGYRYRK